MAPSVSLLAVQASLATMLSCRAGIRVAMRSQFFIAARAKVGNAADALSANR
jgi:hypothetical protein